MAWLAGWKRTRPLVTASIAGLASSSMAMNHCSEISGSIRCPERCENGHRVVVGLGVVDEPLLGELGDDGLLGLGDGHTAEALGGLVGDAAVLADHRRLGQAVAAADLEVVGVVRRA